ncbi:hypothetical protein HXX76_008199 [Chlamydomonas incerta]|uniref:Protein kinase domain-containing protein n=1 Tax=Chlamydomonas incerta TaxID=51695 RepID=A0A835W1J7_CHLIN|nr:hypothetical protein HXX76_008199 [Chlamydomonas incerta]|eukprot:KAG2433843.1 hypothetical protein HXX76_008199 [Chlamydomonas incerta]
MTWLGIDVFFAQATLGAMFRPLRQSPGAILVFSKCLIHRLVGLPFEAGLASARSTERAAAFPRTGAQEQQVVGGVSNMTWAITGPRQSTSEVSMARTAALYDFAADVALDSSLASQGFYFGGYTVVANGPSYDVVDNEVDPACLAARAAIDCLTILLNQLEVDGDTQQQLLGRDREGAATHSGSQTSTSTTTVVIVAVVVPLAVLLLAALVLAALWRARGSRKPGTQASKPTAATATMASGAGGAGCGTSGTQQNVKQSSGGDSREQESKTSGAAGGESGGLRLGVVTGGVQRGDGGGVFNGMEGDNDLPLWTADALREADEPGEALRRGSTRLLSGLINVGRSADGRSTFGGAEAADAASADKLAAGGIHLLLSFGVPQLQQAQLERQPEQQEEAQGPAHGYSATSGQCAAGSAAAAAAAAAAAGAGCIRVKPCDRIPSPEEVLAELGALVKEHRTNVNEVPFTLEAVVGHGSFGTVFKGTWQGLPVAIKTVVFSATQESRRHALKEAALCHSIIHPNIIATYATDLQPIGVLPGAGSDTHSHSSITTLGSSARLYQITDWRLYIIQEFADGGPLGGLYGHPALWLAPGIVNLPAVVPLALGVARALAHLHSKRIVHGDLNPSNVLLKPDLSEPSGYVTKVGDFGLSVMLPQGRTHMSNLRMGTMFYICPAVVSHGQVGPASDVFSLGVLLWELFHGRRAGVLTKEGPRYCTNFPAFPPSCPEGYKAVTLQCLQRHPHNRPPAANIVAALELLLQQMGQLGNPT